MIRLVAPFLKLLRQLISLDSANNKSAILLSGKKIIKQIVIE